MAVAAPPALAEAEVVGPSAILSTRCEIYKADGVTRWYLSGQPVTPAMVDGSISVSYSRQERRTLDVTFENTDNILKHYADLEYGFWYDKILKIFKSVVYTDGAGVSQTWEAQVGEFMIDSIQTQNFPHTVQVTGRDYTKKLLTSKFVQSTSFAQGSKVEDVIRTIAINGGITKIDVPVTGQTLGKNFLFDRGTERWKAITDIATAYGYEVYFDATGYLVMRKFLDPVDAAKSYTFKTGTSGNLVSFSKRTGDSRIYNSIVVTSSDPDYPLLYATARNIEPASPTAIQYIGERVYQYSSSFITTAQQAQDVANMFLQIYALEEFELSLESIALWWLEVGEVIEYLDPDPNPNEPTRFLLTDFTLPIALGSMSSTAKRVTNVG